MIKKVTQIIGHCVDLSISWLYKRYYKLNPRLTEELSELLGNAKIRISQINVIRTNIILVTLWSNAGTVLSLALAILSFFFSAFYIFNAQILEFLKEVFINFQEFETPIYKLIIVIGPFYFSILITLLMSPVLLRKIAFSLPAESYAKISLSEMGQSQILTYVALKMWELCDHFVEQVVIPEELSSCIDISEDKFDSKRFADIPLDIRKDYLKVLQKTIKSYKSQYYKKLTICTELKREATKRLDILPREFCHHIIKFSTAMFETRINRFHSCVESIFHALNSQNWGNAQFDQLMEENLKEMMRIKDDVERRRKRALVQIIAFDRIHENIIGLSSATSTSQSLNIFTRGLSVIAKDMADNGGEMRKHYFFEFKSLLHRSKAHYGFDLLLSLENFYKKHPINIPFNTRQASIPEPVKVPKILHNIFHHTGKTELRLNPYELDAIQKIRENIIDIHFKNKNLIADNFQKAVDKIALNCTGNIFFVVFGYSRTVRDVLRNKANFLESKAAKVFVMKEQNEIMLDTRIFRYELNEKKPEMNIRTSFTSTDHFFYSQVKKEDIVIMLAGAEAYDSTEKVLIHTNNYQLRVESLVKKLKSNDLYIDPKIFILAEAYKVYEKFPGVGHFSGEFFCDHYDKMDYYNFNDIGIDPILVTENEFPID